MRWAADACVRPARRVHGAISPGTVCMRRMTQQVQRERSRWALVPAAPHKRRIERKITAELEQKGPPRSRSGARLTERRRTERLVNDASATGTPKRNDVAHLSCP